MKKTLITCFLFLISCNHKDDYCDLAYDAMSSYAKQMNKKHGFELESVGGEMMTDIQVFNFSLERSDKATIDEARELIIDIAKGFIHKINTDEKIRPFLHNYPITLQNIRVHLHFNGTKKERPGNHFVFITSLIKGKIFYDSFDRSNPLSHKQIIALHRESYDEALQIMKDQYSMKN